ncbi:PREDICTED: uncharacterized protein LOC108576665 isoform X2 [Habropoda laboriosa]|uniref:uncharacterized protein LOC108576665 isoform X2 n=1 Tax=Habropoda laboriosa TaxID=597456 RepID=UPI00083D97EF|nr:PREDICTED: uncharacterized protein LOC108576665 isoform X2 [Habropoda laboriosa]
MQKKPSCRPLSLRNRLVCWLAFCVHKFLRSLLFKSCVIQFDIVTEHFCVEACLCSNKSEKRNIVISVYGREHRRSTMGNEKQEKRQRETGMWYDEARSEGSYTSSSESSMQSAEKKRKSTLQTMRSKQLNCKRLRTSSRLIAEELLSPLRLNVYHRCSSFRICK